MPKQIHGKKLSDKQHRMWRHVYKSMKDKGKDSDAAAAGATSKVMKNMGMTPKPQKREKAAMEKSAINPLAIAAIATLANAGLGAGLGRLAQGRWGLASGWGAAAGGLLGPVGAVGVPAGFAIAKSMKKKKDKGEDEKAETKKKASIAGRLLQAHWSA